MSEHDNENDAESVDQQLPAFLVEAEQEQHADGNNALYKYRDFGRVQEDDEDVSEIPPPTPSSRSASESSIRVQKFPVKLYAILAQKEFHDIICWMPHGRSWKVLKPTMFESLVMPLFFEYSNYHSFNRLVNAWSFRRISSGPDRGSYYHELFLRGKPFLQKYMRRLPKTHKKLPIRKKDEPDFYKLDKTSALPALQDAPIPGAAATSLAMRQQHQQQNQQQQLGCGSIPITNVQESSPVTSIVTPPHLSPRTMTNGFNANRMNYQQISTNNSHSTSSPLTMDSNLGGLIGGNAGLSNDCGYGPLRSISSSNLGMMGLNGGMAMDQNSIDLIPSSGGMMNQSSRMNMINMNNNISGSGSIQSRFNGYSGDSFDPRDEYDLLNVGMGNRGFSTLGHQNNNTNGLMNPNFFGGSNMNMNSIDTSYLSEKGIGGGGRYNVINAGVQSTMNRQRQPSKEQLLAGGGGIGFGGGNYGGNLNMNMYDGITSNASLMMNQDYLSSSFSPQQQQLQKNPNPSSGTNNGGGMIGGLCGQPSLLSSSSSRSSHQLQPYLLSEQQDVVQSRMSPNLSSQQQLNSLPMLNMQQQMYNNRGMGNGGLDEFSFNNSGNAIGIRGYR